MASLGALGGNQDVNAATPSGAGQSLREKPGNDGED